MALNMEARQLNKLLPHQITFEDTYFISGGTYHQILFLDIPKTDTPTPFWLGKLSQKKDINMSLEIIETDSNFRDSISDTVNNLNNSIVEEKGKKKPDSYKLSLLNNRLEKAKKLLNKITKEKQKSYNLRLYVQIHASSENALFRKSKTVLNAFARREMKLSVASYLQEESFLKLFAHPKDKSDQIDYHFTQEALSETISSAFPFTSSNLNDGKGLPIGADSLGNYCMLDFWSRKDGRTNNSIIITGISGRGKSTLNKRIVGYEIAKGTKVLILDPEREFTLIQKNFPNKAMTLDMGSGQRDNINILDINVDGILSTLLNDEELDIYSFPKDYPKLNITSKQLVEYHIEYVMDFLLLILGSPKEDSEKELHKAFLKSALREIYKNKGFSDMTIEELTNIDKKETPRLSDMISVFEKMVNNQRHDSHKKIVVDIIKKLEVTLDGLQGDLWNRPTNVDVEGKDVIIFDMKSLDGVSETTRTAQYTSILNFAWDLVSRNKTENVLLLIEEGHMLIDPRLKEIVRRLKEYQKRIRKYAGALVIATQNLADYMHDAIKNESEAILSNPAYKIFFGADGTEIEVMSKTYNLSKKEKQIIRRAKRGEIIILAGNTKTHIPKIDLFEFEKERLLGKTGGR